VDDSFCLFVIVASLLTFAMPEPAQGPFALFAAALALASRLGGADSAEQEDAGQDRRTVG
jgi:hypothetical protein